jgi:inositol hexakisphosphate/diphosphoinositol-pentakisphosphate kinase
VGICAMDKKAKSKPMKEILGRLPESMFQVIIFGDDTILNRPVEAWPVVEVLIAFYSTKYPTTKVLEYVRLRHPFMINDLEMNDTLKDRRRVYELLQANGIHVPVHVYCERDKRDRNGELLEDANVVEEFDEYILVNGQQINKPLVEKPVDAEDHNIYQRRGRLEAPLSKSERPLFRVLPQRQRGAAGGLVHIRRVHRHAGHGCEGVHRRP